MTMEENEIEMETTLEKEKKVIAVHGKLQSQF